MDSVNWLNLPETIWIDIFDFLDVKSLKSVTETCRTFANLFDSSTKLNRKIRLNVTPDTIEALKKSKRKYRNALLQDIRDAMEEADLRMIQSTLSELEDARISRTHCDNLLMFEAATNLREISIHLDIDENQNSCQKFLTSQKNLKHLSVSSNIKSIIMPPLLPSSQLEYLFINYGEYWANKNDMMTFFSSQQNLRSIELWLHEPWYNGVFELILHNKKLHTVVIAGIRSREPVQLPRDVVCPSVVNLSTYFFEDLRFIESIVQAVPNVKTYCSDWIVGTDLPFISSWRFLESLKLANPDNLRELEVRSEAFKEFIFELCPSIEEINLEMLRDLGRFLRRHRTIRNLKLTAYRLNNGLNRDESFPDTIDAMIAENIPELEILNVDISDRASVHAPVTIISKIRDFAWSCLRLLYFV